jgi:hypothetical protein
MPRNEHGNVPIKLYLQKQAASGFDPQDIADQPLNIKILK